MTWLLAAWAFIKKMDKKNLIIIALALTFLGFASYAWIRIVMFERSIEKYKNTIETHKQIEQNLQAEIEGYKDSYVMLENVIANLSTQLDANHKIEMEYQTDKGKTNTIVKEITREIEKEQKDEKLLIFIRGSMPDNY
jgi:predicted RNase H-like nuclease (RuvC/YqgF family)